MQDDTARTTSIGVRAPFSGAYDLTIVRGPDRGRGLTIDDTSPPRLYVGRSSVCELRLTDPSVSRRHLALELRGDQLAAIDLDSSNCSRFDTVVGIEVLLRGGEQIELGETVLSVARRFGATPAPAAPARLGFGTLCGTSREMQRLYPYLDRLAGSALPVLIEGETGTGKEVLAESLHEAGARSKQPFVVFDCTTVAASLIESELFGSERGAFTGAVGTRTGVFEAAHTGTLFLDEIGDLDLTMQAKLLRAVERGEVRRVGSHKTVKVDVRILSATRRNLDAMVTTGHFRDDLFHRLAVTRVELPPLRRRAGDVARLVDVFSHRLGRSGAEIPLSVLARWELHDWPGNVRELKNAVSRHLELGELAEWQARGGAMTLPPPERDELKRVLATLLDRGLPFAAAREELVLAFEAEFLDRVIRESDGNLTRAAERGGFSRRHLHRLLGRRRG